MIVERLASQVRHRLRAMFRRNAIEQELDEELALHLEMATEANIRRGMTPEASRRCGYRSSPVAGLLRLMDGAATVWTVWC